MASREHRRRVRKAYCINFLRSQNYEVRELPDEYPDPHRRKASRWACRLVNTPEMIEKVRQYVLNNCKGDLARYRKLQALDRQERGETMSIHFGWYTIGKDWYLSSTDWKKLYIRIKDHELNHMGEQFFIFYMY